MTLDELTARVRDEFRLNLTADQIAGRLRTCCAERHADKDLLIRALIEAACDLAADVGELKGELDDLGC